eukprot:g73109.t1
MPDVVEMALSLGLRLSVFLSVCFGFGDITFTAKLFPDGRAIPAGGGELHHRRQDLEVVEKYIKALMLRAQEGGDDADQVGLDLAKFLGVKGKHKKRINELEAMKTVLVKYEEVHKGLSAVLRSGVYTSLSWLQMHLI